MKLAVMVFSATGNTKRVGDVVAGTFKTLGADVDGHEITSLEDREKPLDLSDYDALVFGSPIHSWRAPRVVREWMAGLEGAGRKASMFFTYGGFGVHPSHYTTREILKSRGFVVVSSAEFLGAHTFNKGGWDAVSSRPDESDFAVAREYAEKTYDRFTGRDSGVLGELEKTEHTEETLDAIESFRFKVLTQLPTRNGAECSLCMACQEACPTGAMDAETGEADPSKCIACLRCLDVCPEDALRINDMAPSFAMKLEMEQSSPAKLAEKQSKIYV